MSNVDECYIEILRLVKQAGSVSRLAKIIMQVLWFLISQKRIVAIPIKSVEY